MSAIPNGARDTDDLDHLVDWFETLSPDTVARTREFYASDAFFKDPFNEVTGAKHIEQIYAHMFRQVANPGFRVRERIRDANGTVLIWEFRFSVKPGAPVTIVRGASHLRFNAAHQITWHRDYWDTGEELYGGCRAWAS